jgi:adenosylcobyric acid synthase
VDPLAAVPGVRVAFRPLDDPLNDADAAVLTGTKNTVDDLRALREAGLHDRLRGFDGPVVGLCGGYQLLGRRLVDADIEGVGGEPADGTDAAGDARTALRGVGLLPVETAFSHRKQVAPATWDLDGVGPVAGASGSVEGYEIHGGQTRLATPPAEEDGPTTGATDGTESVAFPFTAADREPVTLGAARGSVLGTYLHGLFENRTAREAFVDCVFAQSATSRPTPGESDTRVTDPYDRAAGLVAGVPLGNLLESVSD